jgi:hypothetical protein
MNEQPAWCCLVSSARRKALRTLDYVRLEIPTPSEAVGFRPWEYINWSAQESDEASDHQQSG